MTEIMSDLLRSTHRMAPMEDGSPGSHPIPKLEPGSALPGGVTVTAVERVGHNSAESCWDCERIFAEGQHVVWVGQADEPGQRHPLHDHCSQLRYRDPLRYIPAPKHAHAFAEVGGAVAALAELNYPGGEFETLIDELADSFAVLRTLVEGSPGTMPQ